MMLRDELQNLCGIPLKTLDQGHKFELLNIDETGVTLFVFATKNERRIRWQEIEGAYRELTTLGEISRSKIQERHALYNTAYVAAMLARLPGVRYTIRPIILYYTRQIK